MSKTQPEPAPIPTSVVLGLNAWNCKSKISPANWETTLNEPVTINPGDSIFVKASYIDTRGTASSNIDILKDTEISLEYYFYWIHNFNACDASGLIINPNPVDPSNNLNQQVLVGRSIQELYDLNKTYSSNTNVPSYLTNPDASFNFHATPINDADGLPYLVYQSTNVIPVPAVYGPVIPACEIVAGTDYVVHTQGLSTNWEYAGVPDSSYNILPPNWVLDSSPFTATANPNGITVPPANPFYDNPGMSPSDFLLPADVNPTLPYVSYMITVLGDTQWDIIDPTSISTDISTNQMVPGTEYAIDDPGNLNWTAFGAASNLPGEEFVYTPPPNAPPAFPITLNTAFFLANAVSFVNPGFPAFGASAGDTFECSIGLDGSGNYTLVSYSGSGQWCYDISSTAYWTLPPATFGVNTTVCPTATNLVISGFSATVGGPVPVSNLTAGDKYTVFATGVLDQSNPPFTWNMVSNLPTTDTANMVAGNKYQVYEYNNVVIPYAPNQGVLTDLFTSQGPIAVPPPTPVTQLSYTYSVTNVPDTPNFASIVSLTLDGVPFDAWTNGFSAYLEITPDANGNCYCSPANNFIEVPSTFFDGVQTVITTINGQSQPGFPPVNVSFVSNRATGDFAGSYLQILRQNPPLVPFPQNPANLPSKLVEIQGQIPSSEVIVYNLNTPNIENIIEYYLTIEGSTKPEDLNPFSISISTDPGGSGLCYYVPYPVSISQGINPPGVDWTYNLPVNLAIQGSAGSGLPNFNLVFGVETCDSLNIYTCKLSPNTQVLFPTVLDSIPFIASGPYTGIASSSTATPLFGTLSAATVSGTGYLQGSVYNTPPKVGSIIKSLFPDPSPPSTGRAAEYPSPFSVNNIIYDGTVKAVITPPTFKADIRPVKKKWKMTLKKGSYDPNYLSQLISRNMSRQRVKRVNNVTGGPFGTQSTLTVPTDSIYNNQPTNWANPSAPGANTFFDSKNPKVYGFPPETDYNLEPDNLDDMPFLFVPAMNSSILHNNPITPTDFIFAEIPHQNAYGLNNLPNPTYYINLVPLISDVRSVSPTIPPMVQSDGYYTILPFYSYNVPNFHGGVVPVAFGATQTSLLYNNENNGLFSFNYLHSPILSFLSNQTSDLTECTMHMYTTNKVSTNMGSTSFFTTLVDKNSGILLNTMNPPEFWNQLGFDIPALTVDLDDQTKIGFQMTYNEFNSKTTGGFCGSSSIFNPTFHTSGSAVQPSCPDTELLFLTAQPGEPIIGINYSCLQPPYAGPFMVVGQQYIILYIGTQNTGDDQEPIYSPTPNWSYFASAANPGDDITNAYVGMPIIATLVGAEYAGNSLWYYNSSDGGHINTYTTGSPSQQFNYPTVYSSGGQSPTSTQLQNTYFTVNNTNTLDAAGISSQRDSTGHYLIEITGYASNYIDDKSKYEVKSIVSTYYIGSAGSFVSQPFPDSYNFFHTGAPITLNNLKVRILNPFDMTEAVVGPNSSVYLQVNKMLTEMATLQVPN